MTDDLPTFLAESDKQPYFVRPMRSADINRIAFIEMHSFSMPWSPLAYLHEINHNSQAYMGVVEEPIPPRARAFLETKIMAFGGMWRRRRHAHISTIASHHEYRGRGFGELMLAALVGRAIRLGAKQVSLDVRVSNIIAQNLYTKYEFIFADRQIGYYSDNQEDAYLMVIPTLDKAYRRRFYERVTTLRTRLYFQDVFSGLKLEQVSL